MYLLFQFDWRVNGFCFFIHFSFVHCFGTGYEFEQNDRNHAWISPCCCLLVLLAVPVLVSNYCYTRRGVAWRGVCEKEENANGAKYIFFTSTKYTTYDFCIANMSQKNRFANRFCYLLDEHHFKVYLPVL